MTDNNELNFNVNRKLIIMFTIEHFQLLQISCFLCRGATTFKEPVCKLCLACCPINTQFCIRCAEPVLVASQKTCARCLKSPPPFNQCHTAFLYAYPVNHIIQKIKYSRQTVLLKPMVRPFAAILEERYHQQPWPQAIIPVPLHNTRLRHRGYDQALLLAKQLKRQLKLTSLKLDTNLVKRIKATEAQQQLKAKERRTNIKNAFICTTIVNYNHVALIDDVITTGETVSEITRLLKKQGVEKVDIWCLAKTPVNR